MKIFTIIVTYNAIRNEWIYKCLDSLLSSDLNTEIIVIDNASTDETCQVIKDKYPTIILIENSKNQGFGAANNQGFEKALELGSDYFFLLNQDAWVEKESIQKLVNCCIENPDFGIISPIHLNGKGDALDYNFSYYVGPKYCKNFYSDSVLGINKENLYELPFVNAACWMLTTETLRKIGGFNPSFFHYGEDENFCHRVSYHQLKIGVLKNTYMCHDREDRLSDVQILRDNEEDWLVYFSDPRKTLDWKREFKLMKVNYLKNKLMGRTMHMKKNMEKFKYLKLNAAKILKNTEISKSVNDYKFLK